MIFIAELLVSIAGANNICLSVEKYWAKQYIPLRSDNIAGKSYFALIVDCGSDGSVATALLDRHAGLTAAGYSVVLGVRDLFPIPDADYDLLDADLTSIMPSTGARTRMVIARQEVEAWFAQEDSHFPKIDSRITAHAIKAALGFDVINDCAESLPKPAQFLHDAYQIGGKAYKKSKKSVQRTVIALDLGRVYSDLPAKLPSLKILTDEIETFMQ